MDDISRREATNEANLDKAYEKLEEHLVAVESALRGVAMSAMKGRSRSGFIAAGYHEPSYLYGVYVGWAEYLGAESEGMHAIRERVEQDARERFVREVAEAGASAFDHPNVAERR